MATESESDPDRTPPREGEKGWQTNAVEKEEDFSSEEEQVRDFLEVDPVVAKSRPYSSRQGPKTVDPEWVDERSDGLYCLTCIKSGLKHKEGVWTQVPCTNRRDRAGAVRKHNTSKQHLAAVAQLNVKPMPDHLEEANERAVAALMKRFRSLYWLAKEKIAHKKFESLLELEELNGVYKGLEDLFVKSVYTYTSTDFVGEALRCIATVVHKDRMEDIHSSPFFSFIVDESMDAANQSQLALYYKSCKKGKPLVTFGGLLRLKNGKATTVAAAIRWRFLKDNLSVAKAMCMGSDGAAVMLGCNCGVAVRMGSLNPAMVCIHCGGHRGSLASKGAADDLSYLHRTFFPITEQLGRYYADSATRTATLEAQQEACGLSILKIIMSAFTRWLSQDGVTKVVQIRFVPIVKDLRANSESDATALGLFTTLCSRDYIASLLLQRDCLPQLARLSKLFQDPFADWSVIELQLPAVLDHIEGQIEKPGPYYAGLDAFIAEVEAQGLSVRKVTGRGEVWLETTRVQYLQGLVAHLRARFPAVPLLAALFRLFHAHGFPEEKEDLRSFGDKELEVVLSHYGECGTVDSDDTKLEWMNVRTFFAQFRGQEKAVKVVVEDEDATWDVMEARPTKEVEKKLKIPVSHMIEAFLTNETMVKLNPNFYLLAVLYTIMTKDSADCERGFSVMKQIKTSLRTKLSQATLEQLMYIAINGPEIAEFDFLAAVRLFVNLTGRSLKTPTLVSVAAGKKANALAAATFWGKSVEEDFIAKEEARDLGAVDVSRVFSGSAATGRPPATKRKEAAELVRALKKSRKEENHDLTLAISQANQKQAELEEEEEVRLRGEESEDSLFEEKQDGQACKECGGFTSKLSNKMLLCDGSGGECPLAFHQLCLDPPVLSLPKANEKWFCPGCDVALERTQSGRRQIPTAKARG